LTFGDKVSRLGGRLKDPEWRRYLKLLFAGKMLGILACLAIMLAIRIAPEVFSSGSAHAQEAAPAAAAPAETPPDPYTTVKPGDTVNPINTTWTLVAAFLVFGMQVGFTMLEAGFCRSRETVNVLMECVVDTCLCGLCFYAWGFAFMFGHGNGIIGKGAADGTTWYFLQNAPATYEGTGVAFLAVWIFQFAFADTCS